MTEPARREYAAVMRARYQQATKRERGRLLDEYCRTTGCHRKAAIRRLRRGSGPPRRAPGRPVQYAAPALGAILERAWLASDQLSGKLLRPILPALLTALATHHRLRIPSAVQAALTRASAATLDRLLRPLRRRRPRHPRRLAPAPASLRAQVPLRTWSEWAGVPPGALQGDLVLHCGETTAGRYCATLVAVDVATSWTEVQALYDLHHQRVTGAIQHLAQRLPFPLREWHNDNGSEFINAALLGWCRHRGVRFTRGRPYRKNDQAWVEQRNGLLVRRLVGYDRYRSRAAWTVLGRLYGLLRLQHNFFRPVRKLRSKQRVGHKVLKRYDAAQTPYQRVLAAGGLPAAQRQALAAQFAALDPIALARDIQQTLDVLWKLTDTRPPRQEAARG
ncbi:MAG TPA: transposase family protein [Candidatus Deferrimicrobiaceae bacterium]|nr:transposase family protein [Candidatus Deferrimicrobiaceae bacterium]